mgnify:CR=1 FL=1
MSEQTESTPEVVSNTSEVTENTKRPLTAGRVLAAIGFTVLGVVIYGFCIGMFSAPPGMLAGTWVGISLLSLFALFAWFRDERRAAQQGEDDEE